MASWVIISRLWVIIVISKKFILINKTSSEHYCFIFSNIYQNNDQIGSGFPPNSGHIPPTSGSFDWPNWDPHIV